MTGIDRKSFEKVEFLGHESRESWFVHNVIFFLLAIPSPLFYNGTSLLFGRSALILLCVILVSLSIMWSHKFHRGNGPRSQKSRSECVHHLPGQSDWNLSRCSAHDPRGASQIFFQNCHKCWVGKKRVFFPCFCWRLGWCRAGDAGGYLCLQWRGREKPRWHCI